MYCLIVSQLSFDILAICSVSKQPTSSLELAQILSSVGQVIITLCPARKAWPQNNFLCSSLHSDIFIKLLCGISALSTSLGRENWSPVWHYILTCICSGVEFMSFTVRTKEFLYNSKKCAQAPSHNYKFVWNGFLNISVLYE